MNGRDRLWHWFGCSRASFLTLPRAGMHQMPDEWQDKMADLLEQWEEASKNPPDIETTVRAVKEGKLVKMPDWVRNYRHPDKAAWDEYFGR